MSRITRMGAHVNLTIIGIPEELLREFCEYVVKPFYEGDISEGHHGFDEESC